MKGCDITDAHVGFYTRFARLGIVLANLNNEPRSYDYELNRIHLDILKSETDADGNKINVFTLSPPFELRDNEFTRSDTKIAAGYINYTLINGVGLLPEFCDDISDSSACEIFGFIYPRHDIIKINIDAIASGGGGIHRVIAHYPSA